MQADNGFIGIGRRKISGRNPRVLRAHAHARAIMFMYIRFLIAKYSMCTIASRRQDYFYEK